MNARTIERIFSPTGICQGDLIEFPSAGLYQWYCRGCGHDSPSVLTAEEAEAQLRHHVKGCGWSA